MVKGGWQRPWVRGVTTLLTLAVMVMIFCFSMQDAAHSDETSGTISQAVIRVLYPDYPERTPEEQQEIYDNVQHVVRKCAHFSEYTLLGFLMRLCFESWFGAAARKRGRLAIFSTLAGAEYACTDELHQLLIDGRSGQWTDVLIDSLGVTLGVLLAGLLISRTARRTAAAKPQT